ncbi:unnamed protein product [Ixodes hexagonus]
MIGGQASVLKAYSTMTKFDRRDGSFHSCPPLPKAIAGFAVLGLPEDKKALLGRPWPGKNAAPQTRWNAAITIQRAYRQYRRGGNPQRCSFDTMQLSLRTSYHGGPPKQSLPAVQIEKWPPSARSSTTIESKSGGCIGDIRYLHYEPLPPDMDPNLGMLINMDNSFLKTKTLLGLRMTPENLSAGIRLLRLARQPCDPCLPVILLFGGLDPRNPLDTGSAVLQYHPFKDRWMLVNVMPEQRSYHAAACINDTVFVTGGYSAFLRKSGEMVATKTTFAMNTETGAWERFPDMIFPRACHASIAAAGRVFVFGGRGHDGRLMSSTEEYNFRTHKWEPRSTMPESRMGMAIAVKNDLIWLMGGMSDRGRKPVVSDVFTYSPKLDRQ